MYSIYLDSSAGLVVGLLNPDFTWLEYSELNEKKPSEIIHFEIFQLLRKNNLNLKDVRCFLASGPGSYTGMRLSEGLGQIFELSKIPVYSFYHFDVPRFIGIECGEWVTTAFKGQVFKHVWSLEKNENILINKESFNFESGNNKYCLDRDESPLKNFQSTKKIIKEDSLKLFSHVLKKKLRVPPYYFRTLEEEFR